MAQAPEKMEAIIAKPPRRNSIRVARIPKPKAETDEALLKVRCVGIDGTDREINEGIYGIPPIGSDYIVIGHEAVAKVETVGDESSLSEGDLVVPTVRRPCEENCPSCQIGATDMCLTGNYREHGIIKLHGFASEYAVSEASSLVKIPEELKDTAVLLEPLSIAEKAVSQLFRIQGRIRMWQPERALILGAGSLGLLASMLLRLKGLEVTVSATRSRESMKAKIAQSIGARYLSVRETPLNSVGEEFDVIIEATGRVEPTLEALTLLGPNSVMCLLGIYREKEACQEFGKVLTDIVLGNRLIFGSVSSSKDHFEMGIRDMQSISKQYGNVLGKLITKRLQLKDFEKAFSPEREDIKTTISFT